MERGQCGGPHGEGRSRPRAERWSKELAGGACRGALGGGARGGGKVPSEGLGLAALGCFHLLQPSRLLCILEKFRPR